MNVGYPNKEIPELKFSDFERFFHSYYFKKDTGCWIWTKTKIKGRYKSNSGYGVMGVGRSICRAHRVSYKLFFGNFKKELDVLHRCDNPSCVNPNHLFLGTDEDNQRDRVAKGRHDQATKTHCSNGHEFNKENTIFSKTQRVCKICRKIRKKRYLYAKNKNSCYK